MRDAALSTLNRLTEVESAATHSPGRRVIVSERQNFPTDLYVAEGLCRDLGWSLELLEPPAIVERLSEGCGSYVSILMLTLVN